MTTQARALRAQIFVELVLTFRRGESVLITIVVPVALLVFFASLNLTAVGRPIDFLLPGIVALAVIATSLVSLGIATAYERHYMVLKRLGSSPLSRWELLTAKVASVFAVEAIQVLVLLIIGMIYGWRPTAQSLAAVPIVALGTATFAGMGLSMAGAWRAEATLAGANGLYLACLLLSDAVLPLDHVPDVVRIVAGVLPPALFTDIVREALSSGMALSGDKITLLAAWTVALAVLAIKTFRWE